ncbi:MAG: hypothetical protein HZY75_03395 [Nocardioidaceae bacterium]|nr:MAG: hypothetical protein HZY75_03395 [Nocardioidaceae bacterium]
MRAQQAVRPANRSKLVEFLREQRAVSDQVVVKDPRSVWFQQLWREACAEADFDIKYISMLRHPAEVIGSRTTYYSDSENSDEKQRRYQALTLARWINNSLINERATRGYSRAFVGYDELLTDWRKVATRLQDEFDLRYATNVEPGTHHAVDDFIDPDLRRHRVTWQELDLPEYLQSMAEQVWDLLQVLAEHGGVDEESSKRLDEIATSYAGVLNDAIGISQDAVLELIEDARENAINEYRAELTIRQSDEQAAQDVQGMRVGEVGSRDLLRVIASRAKRKLTRA